MIAASLVLFALLGGIIGTTIGLVRAVCARGGEKTERVKAEGLANDNAKLADEEGKAKKKAEYQLGISTILLANAALGNDDVKVANERLDLVPEEQRGWEWHYLKQQSRGGLFTLPARGPVTAVAYSPDGSRIATIGGSQQDRCEARVWDAVGQAPVRAERTT